MVGINCLHVALFLFCVGDSKFGDIFDEDFFIYALSKNVNVVKELPKDMLERYNYNISSIVNLRLKAWSSPAYYLQKVLPQLLRLGYGIHLHFSCSFFSNCRLSLRMKWVVIFRFPCIAS